MRSIEVEESPSGRRIILSRPFDTRDKVLYIIYAVSFLFSACIFLWVFLYESLGLIPSLILLCSLAVFTVAFYRFAKRATSYEELYIDSKQLKIIRGSYFGSTKVAIELDRILGIDHLDKPDLTDHPLKGASFDYLGFQTEQKVISEMHGDNRIRVQYDDNEYYFGTDVYSWEFDQIRDIIDGVRGSDFKLVR